MKQYVDSLPKYIVLTIVTLVAIALFVLQINNKHINYNVNNSINKNFKTGENEYEGVLSGYYAGYDLDELDNNKLLYDNLELDYDDDNGWRVGISFDISNYYDDFTEEQKNEYKIAIDGNIYDYSTLNEGNNTFVIWDSIDKNIVLNYLSNNNENETSIKWTKSINWNPTIEDDTITNPEEVIDYTIEINNLLLNKNDNAFFEYNNGKIITDEGADVNGDITFFTEGTYDNNTITFSNLDLDYNEVDGWWTGWKISAPAFINENNYEDATFSTDGGDTYTSFKDSMDGEYYLELWNLITPQIIMDYYENNTPIEYMFKFKWTNSIYYDEQIVNVIIDPSNIILNKEDSIFFRTIDDRIVINNFIQDNGTVDFYTEGTYENNTLTFSDLNLDYNEIDGWYVGWKMTAPTYVNANNYEDITISSDGGNTYTSFSDEMDGEYYLDIWNLITPEDVIDYYENNTPIEWNYKFKWINNNALEEQSIKVVINPSNITLNKENKVFFKTIDDRIVINNFIQDNGTVDFYTDGTYENDTVTFSGLNLDYNEVDGWYVGWKMITPTYVNANNYEDITISLDGGNTYIPFSDEMDGNYYLDSWNIITPEKIIAFYKNDTPIEWHYKFRWIDNNALEEQDIYVVIDPSNVVLNKNGRVYFKTENGKVVIQNYETVNGSIEFITEGTLENNTITFSNLDLDFYESNSSTGRTEDGWWFGWKMTAPALLDATNYEDAQVSFDNGETYSYFKDLMDDEYYMDIWNSIDYDKIVDAINGAKPLHWDCIFKWDGDGKLYDEQHITVNVDPNNVTLHKDGRIHDQTIDGEYIYINDIPQIKYSNEIKHSYRLNKSVVNYRVKRLYTNQGVDYIDIIDENNNPRSLSYSDFISTYTGFDSSILTLSSDGNIVFHYNLSPTEASKIDIDTSDNVDIYVYGLYDNKVQYYTSDNTTYEVSLDKFNQATVTNANGLLDRTNYEYTNGCIYLPVGGYKYGYEPTDKSIKYNGGGKFTFSYNYTLAEVDDFSRGNLIITHKDYDNDDNTFNVYERTYDGWRWDPYDPSLVNTLVSSAFKVSYDVDDINKRITYTIIYDSNDINYSGIYSIKTIVAGKEIDVVEFEIENSERDYFVTSSVDLNGNDDLNGSIPPSNKKYGYDIGVHMIKGTVDPSYDYLTNNLNINIFDKMVDINNDKYTFYNLADYKLQIINYKNNTIKYSVDNGGVITETINGSSNFETKYVDAYNLLNNYIFDADGNINPNEDNYAGSITKYYQRGTSYYVLYNGNEVNIRDYVSQGGNLNTLIAAAQRFNYDDNNNVIRGLISGSYKINVENNIVYNSTIYNSHLKNNLFNITINDSPYDISHVVNITPKGEVQSINYYAYISYSNTMNAIGYLNNDDNLASIDDVVIQPDIYPEYWNKNVRMAVLAYDNPIYTVELNDPILANSSDDKNVAYANVASNITFETTLEDIFDYSNFNVSVKDSNNTNVTSRFSIKYSSKIGDNYYQTLSSSKWNRTSEINNNVNPTHYIQLSYNSVPMDDYTVTISYRGFSDSKTFSINDNYYSLVLDNNNTDELIYSFDISRNKRIRLISSYVDKNDISLNIYKGEQLLDKDSNSFNLNNIDYFNYSITQSNNGSQSNINISLGNIQNVTQVGDYTLVISYRDASYEIPITISPEVVDNRSILLENEYPTYNNDEVYFTKDITTTDVDIDNISYYVYYLDGSNKVDISSSTVNAATRGIYNITLNDKECTNNRCTGKLKFFIDVNKIDFNKHYYINYSYDDMSGIVPITKLVNMYSWGISNFSISGTYEEENINSFYRNILDTSISIDLINTTHNVPVNYSIIKIVDFDENNPIVDNYKDLFNVTINGNNITLTPKYTNNISDIEAGNYKIVLYYSLTDYKTYNFVINERYGEDPPPEEITIIHGSVITKSNYLEDGNTIEIPTLHTNLNGVVEIPTTITGIDYSLVTRTILDSSNNNVNNFTLNTLGDFVDKRKTIITYNPNNHLNEGSYRIITSYMDNDNNVYVDSSTFTINQAYFDYSIQNIETNPSTLIVSRKGDITLTIKTTAVDNLFDRINGFKNNVKVYDSNNTNITDRFVITVTPDLSMSTNNKFYIKLTYNKNALSVGDYSIKTSYTIDNKTVSHNEVFSVSTIDRYIDVEDEVGINSNTSDNLIHRGQGGTFTINYVSEEDVHDEISVQITDSNNVNKKSLFNISIDEDSIDVELLDSTSIDEGEYKVLITFNSTVYIVSITIHGDYNPVLNSTVYEVTHGSDPTIYIKSLNNGQMTYTLSEFINNVQNLMNNYRIKNSKDIDVTSTTEFIGTGYKIINPDDTTYTVILIGDLTGDGKIELGDVAKLYSYYKKKQVIEDKYVKKAAKIVESTSNIPELGDVAKLFNYYKHKINKL